MFTRQDRSRRLTLRATGAVSIAAALALLNGCIVQERVYAPPPDGYTPAPSEYTPPANEYPPSSQDYPQSSQDYPQAAPAYEYAEPRIEVRAAEPPPPLPYYEQPPCPEPGYLWTPGYWGYSTEGYFWVPGTWLMPPQVGVLWTPGYWGWGGGVYVFHAGYWGPHVGFYGGINYGGGYIGEGYEGGRWERDRFSYNTSVNNINTTIIHNTYNQTVVNNVTVNRVSYNGGRGGVAAAPSNRDQLAARESHIPPPVMQTRHINEAARTPELQARVNQGRPPIAATPRPAAFTAPNIVRARGATIPPPAAPGALRPAEQGNHSALDTRPGYREPSSPALTTRAPTDASQQRPQPQAQFAQPQQRSQPQPQFAQPQQRSQPQPQFAQPQQHPQPQPQFAQPQQRPQPQPQFTQPQQRPQPQPPPAQPQQRPQPQAPQPPPAAHPQTPRDEGRHEGNR